MTFPKYKNILAKISISDFEKTTADHFASFWLLSLQPLPCSLPFNKCLPNCLHLVINNVYFFQAINLIRCRKPADSRNRSAIELHNL